jgi:electron transport complex protein RnfG
VIDIIKITLALTITGIAATLLITFTYSKTEAKIHDQQIQAEVSMLKSMMSGNAHFTELNSQQTGLPSQYWVGTENSDTSYIFKICSFGYSGPIVFLVCVTTDGIINEMKILEQKETPGLGGRIQEVLSNKFIWDGFFKNKGPTTQWFTEQFRGINLLKDITIEKRYGEWHKINNDEIRGRLIQNNAITAITGSTISTRAVIKGIESQAKVYLSAVRGNK